MFLSDAAVRRPVAMSCLIIALTLLGLNAYRKLGLELMPKLDLPYITILTVYPGASPEEIETDVAKRIEDAVVSLDGLKHVDSTAMENLCLTLLEFQLDVDVDIAATDVREKLDLIRADFPADVEDPKIQKFDVNAKPIVNLALTGDVPLDELYDYADNTLRDRLSVISGVADVQLIGGAEREVQVQLERRLLSARGLTTTDVVQTIQKGVRTIPSGRVREGGTEYTVKFDADTAELSDLAGLEVANRQGQRVRISDLGRVVMGTEEYRQKAFIDGQPGVAIRVVKKSDANAVWVARAVREALAQLQKTLPGGMELVWVADDGTFIEATNSSAWVNVFQGIILTASILFIFLYNFRSLLVVAITMPITIIIGLFFMHLAGFTLNTSTLIAVGLSVGILVANSIVVLEAIVKRLDQTGDPRDASRLGASEAFVAVLASAGTNIVVLFPLSAMGSTVGLFIKPLALTMLIMTAVSLFISFTLTPLLTALLLKPRAKDARGPLAWMERGWNRGLSRVVRGYRALLVFTERRRWAAALVLFGVVGLFFHALGLGGDVGSSLVSDSDQGQVYVKLEFPTAYDLARSEKRVREAQRRLDDVPELRHVLTTIGKVEGIIGQSTEGVYLAQLLLKFSERTERVLTMGDLLEEVRSRLADYADAIITVTVPTIIGGQSAPVELVIAGDHLEILERIALDARTFAWEIPGVLEPDTTVREGKPELRIRPRRAVLSDLGYPATGLGLTLRANLEGIVVGTFKRNARNYDIVVKLAEEEGKRQVKDFRFPGAPGHATLLGTLATVEETRAPIQITRKDKRRIAKLLANLGPDLPLGTAVQRIGAAIDERGNLPPGYDYHFAGMYEAMSEGQGAMGEAGLIAIVLVILTLAAILESFKQPGLILVTLPLALIGVIWALVLTGQSLDIFGIMGCVMMIGIVVNNAILIMDQCNRHVAEGYPRHGAMVTAACERFRPIVMTTLAAVLGMLPLALGQGIGAEMRNGVGVVSVGGILVSGVLTLLVMPILYDLFTRRGSTQTTRAAASPEEGSGGSGRVTAVRLVVLVVLLAFAGTTARAGDIQPVAETTPALVLTLAEALQIADRQNRDMQMVREQRNRLEGGYTEARSAALPQVTATANVLRQRDTSQEAIYGSAPPAATAKTIDLGLSQTLFAWGQVTAGIRAAGLARETTTEQIRLARQTTGRDVATAFYDILLVQELGDLARQNLGQRQRHLVDAQKRFAAGVATDYDVLAAEVAVKNARPEVIRADNSIRTAKDLLRFLLALGDREVVIEGSLATEAPVLPTYERALDSALAKRPELREVLQRRGIAQELVAVAQAGDKPRLDLRANYGWRQLETDGAEKLGPEWAAGLFVAWPLFDGLRTRGKVAQARSDAETLRIGELRLLDALALEVRTARNAAWEATEVVGALEGTVTQAERLLAMAETGFAHGVKTRLEVDDAQLNLSLAQSNLARARRDYLVARTELQKVMGVLWEPAE